MSQWDEVYKFERIRALNKNLAITTKFMKLEGGGTHVSINKAWKIFVTMDENKYYV